MTLAQVLTAHFSHCQTVYRTFATLAPLGNLLSCDRAHRNGFFRSGRFRQGSQAGESSLSARANAARRNFNPLEAQGC